MRLLSKIKLTHIVWLLAAMVSQPMSAATPDVQPDEMELSVSENLDTPAVPKKSKQTVRTAMDGLRRSLLKHGLDTKSMRDGEVLKINIPCSELFAPNSKSLKAKAGQILKPIISVASQPKDYKLVIAVHADNTGDESYADALTEARANAIDDYIWNATGQSDTSVVPYGLGRDEPLTANDSALNRNKNRRVEIFIVPREGLFK